MCVKKGHRKWMLVRHRERQICVSIYLVNGVALIYGFAFGTLTVYTGVFLGNIAGAYKLDRTILDSTDTDGDQASAGGEVGIELVSTIISFIPLVCKIMPGECVV